MQIRISERTSRYTLVFILASFITLGTIYSVATPIFEASDELWHFPVVQHIASGNGLPVQGGPENPGLWKQEASQPPLYYLLTGIATAWIDTHDLSKTLLPNPHARPGDITAADNINLVVHDLSREAFPWKGTALAVHVARLLSILMSAVAVYLTYKITLTLFPRQFYLALGAAAINAYTPMFIFISGSVNNDNLAVMLSSLTIYLLIQLIHRTSKDSEISTQPFHSLQLQGVQGARSIYRNYPYSQLLWLGLVMGLAILSKVSNLGLLPIASAVVALIAWRRRSWCIFVVGQITMLGMVALVSGWWFLRNLSLYGDLLGFSKFLPFFQRAIPADLIQIAGEWKSFFYGYWGNFGGLNVPMPDWCYTFFYLLTLAAAAGLIFGLARLLWAMKRQAYQFHFSHWGLVVTIVWALVVLISWVNWTSQTWSSQGRLVFPAISSWSLLIALGISLLQPLPRRIFIVYGVGVVMLIVASILPQTVIAPPYTLPPQLNDEQIAEIPKPLDVTFGDQIKLLGYTSEGDYIQSGQSVTLTLFWQVIAPVPDNFKVFVHLVDDNGIIVNNEGDTYPGGGLLLTQTLQRGRSWAEQHVITVPPGTYAPGELHWEIGLYKDDSSGGSRLSAADSAGVSLGDSVQLGHIILEGPIRFTANFGNQMELNSYSLENRLVHQGETITLTLYWRGLTQLVRDYTVTAQVLQISPLTVAAQKDQQPAPPTTQWLPGQVISDSVSLTFKDGVPTGVYEVRIAVYFWKDSGGLERLPVITGNGQLTEDAFVLGKIRVLPGP
jgi:4-amino-4-deoxy-L-arabinose transferase-like glycosyltransferase